MTRHCWLDSGWARRTGPAAQKTRGLGCCSVQRRSAALTRHRDRNWRIAGAGQSARGQPARRGAALSPDQLAKLASFQGIVPMDATTPITATSKDITMNMRLSCCHWSSASRAWCRRARRRSLQGGDQHPARLRRLTHRQGPRADTRRSHRREADAEAGLDGLDRARPVCAQLPVLSRTSSRRGREGNRLVRQPRRRLLRRVRILRGFSPTACLPAPRCISRPSRTARRAAIDGSRCRHPAKVRMPSRLRLPA